MDIGAPPRRAHPPEVQLVGQPRGRVHPRRRIEPARNAPVGGGGQRPREGLAAPADGRECDLVVAGWNRQAAPGGDRRAPRVDHHLHRNLGRGPGGVVGLAGAALEGDRAAIVGGERAVEQAVTERAVARPPDGDLVGDGAARPARPARQATPRAVEAGVAVVAVNVQPQAEIPVDHAIAGARGTCVTQGASGLSDRGDGCRVGRVDGGQEQRDAVGLAVASVLIGVEGRVDALGGGDAQPVGHAALLTASGVGEPEGAASRGVQSGALAAGDGGPGGRPGGGEAGDVGVPRRGRRDRPVARCCGRAVEGLLNEDGRRIGTQRAEGAPPHQGEQDDDAGGPQPPHPETSSGRAFTHGLPTHQTIDLSTAGCTARPLLVEGPLDVAADRQAVTPAPPGHMAAGYGLPAKHPHRATKRTETVTTVAA